MNDLTELFGMDPYSLNNGDKERLITPLYSRLTRHHYQNCSEYKNILNSLGIKLGNDSNLVRPPGLPVQLFKRRDLLSVPRANIIKTITSSGTSGQQPSRIFLDKETASNQIKTLSRIVTATIGNKRLPMIILDTEAVISDRSLFSARGAGVLGFSMFAKDRIFALDASMELQFDRVGEFIDRHSGEQILVFGFTYIVWAFFYKWLLINKKVCNLANATLFHGGGWKKLESESVSSELFKQRIEQVCGLKKIYSYYGMAEQTGSIFVECAEGYLHTSNFTDVFSVDNSTLADCDFGQRGILEVHSVLPSSYPGHVLLTEDEGIIYGVDTCKCGTKGKYFKVLGRVEKAEIRGCSDTFTRN